MYILKNAWLNIKRNKGRNFLIGIIIFTIGCACTVTLAIKNTSNSLISSYKDAYKVEATIGFNRNNMMKNNDFTNEEGLDNMKDIFASIPPITLSDVENYSDSEYVKDYYYTSTVSLNSNNIEKVSSDFSFSGKSNRPANDINGNVNNADFNLMGYSSLESMNEFIDGNYTLTEKDEDIWNKIFNGDYCLINNELAELNDIEVGDVI